MSKPPNTPIAKAIWKGRAYLAPNVSYPDDYTQTKFSCNAIALAREEYSNAAEKWYFDWLTSQTPTTGHIPDELLDAETRGENVQLLRFMLLTLAALDAADQGL